MTLRFLVSFLSTVGQSSLDPAHLKTSTLPKYSEYYTVPIWGSSLALCQWY